MKLHALHVSIIGAAFMMLLPSVSHAQEKICNFVVHPKKCPDNDMTDGSKTTYLDIEGSSKSKSILWLGTAQVCSYQPNGCRYKFTTENSSTAGWTIGGEINGSMGSEDVGQLGAAFTGSYSKSDTETVTSDTSRTVKNNQTIRPYAYVWRQTNTRVFMGYWDYQGRVKCTRADIAKSCRKYIWNKGVAGSYTYHPLAQEGAFMEYEKFDNGKQPSWMKVDTANNSSAALKLTKIALRMVQLL